MTTNHTPQIVYNIPGYGLFRRGLASDRIYGLIEGEAIQIRKHNRGHFRWCVVRDVKVIYPPILGRGTTRKAAMDAARVWLTKEAQA